MKPLSTRLAWLLLFLPFLPAAAAQDEAWRPVVARWLQVSSKDSRVAGDILELESSAREMRAWISSPDVGHPPETHAKEKYSFTTFDFIIAKGWAGAGDCKKALQYLKADAAQPGPFLHETRNPNYFALDVFKLHSEIMAHTGKVADIPYSGYQVFAGPPSEGVTRYIFVWEPAGTDDRGILVQGVADDEQRHEITSFECGPEKRSRFVSRAQVISERGKLKVSTASRPGGFVLVLKGLSKVVEFKGEFEVPFVHPSPRSKIELLLDQDRLEQPLNAIARMDGKVKDSK